MCILQLFTIKKYRWTILWIVKLKDAKTLGGGQNDPPPGILGLKNITGRKTVDKEKTSAQYANSNINKVSCCMLKDKDIK